MKNNGKFLDIASIKFGDVRFLIKQTPLVSEYFTTNFSEEELMKLVPSANVWYKKVLSLLGLKYDRREGVEVEVEAVIYSVISWDKTEVFANNPYFEDKKAKEFEEFLESPLVLKNKEENKKKEKKIIIKFALRVRKNEE